MSFGLYMNPPRHAAVVSIDEKSQIQALNRTQPGLPLKRGMRNPPARLQTPRHGDDPVRRAPACSKARVYRPLRGRAIGIREFIRFIATVERSVPAGKVIHAILDNYGPSP